MNFEINKLLQIRATAFFILIAVILLAGCASNQTATKQTEKGAVESIASKLITQISTTEDSEAFYVGIKGNQLLSYTSVKQPVPLGVLLYFPETALGDINTTYMPESDLVGSINASELTDKGHTSRIEIALKQDASYEVIRQDNDLKVIFNKVPPASTSTEQVIKTQEERPAAETQAMSAAASTAAAPAQAEIRTEASPKEVKPLEIDDSKPAWVNRIDFSSEEAGKSTIIIGTTKPIQYDIKKINEKKLLLNLNNTNIPEYRQRPMITTRFASAVDRITPLQSPKMKGISMISIELRESVPYVAEQVSDLLMLHFEASSIPPKTLDEAKLPPWQKVTMQPMAATAAVESEISATATAAPQPSGKYTGEKIALNFYQTDIKNVFRILMDVSKKNFAIDKDVSGSVTLTFDKPVPWDQVLDLVLRMNMLGMVYEGDIVRIATQKTLEGEVTQKQAELAANQKATAQKVAAEPLITEFIPVNYADASADVLPHIVLTEGRGSITVDTRNNQIIMTDVAEKIKQAKETVEQIDKVTPQVIIEARIVEATNTFSRDLGTQWQVTGKPAYDNTSGSHNANFGGDLAFDMSATNPPASSLGSLGISFLRTAGSQISIVNAQIAASESKGLVKIISSPKILTLDNTPATIKQGLSYPFNKLDADGNTTTEFKDIALELEVTPHVTPDNRISMKITVKNNEIGSVINNQISFTTKEASTELLVNDGDTVIIGGIRKATKNDNVSGVPGLKDIPLLGWLFKRKNTTDNLEELLIFITPRIIILEQRNLGG